MSPEDRGASAPNEDEDRIDPYPSADGTLLVLRTSRAGEDAGRLCTFDTSDPTDLVELGCHEYEGDADTFVVIADPDPG